MVVWSDWTNPISWLRYLKLGKRPIKSVGCKLNNKKNPTTYNTTFLLKVGIKRFTYYIMYTQNVIYSFNNNKKSEKNRMYHRVMNYGYYNIILYNIITR